MKVVISEELLSQGEFDSRWNDGPFLALKLLPAKAKGKRFEQIASEIFKAMGLTVNKPTNTDHDRVVDGIKCEIKGSTVTKGSDDCFSFLQIRPAQDYEALVLVTFWFDGTVKIFKLLKSDVMTLVENGTLKKQHGGNRAESGTYCYNGNLTPFENFHWQTVQVG